MRLPATTPPARPVAAAVAVVALLGPPAAAQEGPARWADLIAPDRIAMAALGYVIAAARTQADITYGDLSVDVASGRFALSDLSVWPPVTWGDGGGVGGACQVSVAEVVVLGTPWAEVEDGRLTFSVTDLSAPIDCLPPDARIGLAMAGLPEVHVPSATLDVRYRSASSSATVALFVDLEGTGAVEAVAELPYVWGREGAGGEFVPVVLLSGASVSFEDGGAAEQAARFLPPRATDPATAEAFAREVLTPLVAELTQGTLEELLSPPSLDGSAEALVESAAVAWEAFVEARGRLTLEVAPDRVLSVGPALAKDPAATLEALRPVVTAERPAADPTVEPALIAAALAGDELAQDERRRVGLALLTGRGAPRAREVGLGLLEGLEVGEPALALTVAEALVEADPEAAYARALAAGGAEVPGALGVLDEAESRLPLATVLRLQDEAAGETDAPEAGDGRALRRAASRRLSGRGLTRSYLEAATLARLGAAAGDVQSAAVLERIDARAAAAPEPERDAWAELQSEAARRALEAYAGTAAAGD